MTAEVGAWKGEPGAEEGPQISATISRIRLTQLFGLYSYDIPGATVLGRTPILYGENGLGKTNVLKIIFHMLSAAEDRGHRSALAKTKFKTAEILLSNGVYVAAERGEQLLGGMRLSVRKLDGGGGQGRLLGAWNYTPKDEMSRDTHQRLLANVDPIAYQRALSRPAGKGRNRAIQELFLTAIEKESNPLETEEAFYKALREHVPRVYLLTADRILRSDAVSRDSYRPRVEDAAHLRSPEAMLTRGREHALTDAVERASIFLSQLGVDATREGSRSAHSIYEDLIQRFTVRQSAVNVLAGSTLGALKTNLQMLALQYGQLSAYGLAPKLRGKELVELLDKVQTENQSVAIEVMTPYVESLTTQANRLGEAFRVIDTFVKTVNAFLYDKSISFMVGRGLMVRNKLDELLDPSDLSSGEQQLLLLFCHIVIAHTNGGIFIIDEPEISLNIKWQRRLVDALSTLDPSQNLQFVLASHSMEILSRHDESVVPLPECVIHG